MESIPYEMKDKLPPEQENNAVNYIQGVHNCLKPDSKSQTMKLTQILIVYQYLLWVHSSLNLNVNETWIQGLPPIELSPSRKGDTFMKFD